MAVRAYFDGSGSPRTKAEQYLTLGSYSGSEKAWQYIEPKWQAALKEFGAPYLHMREAMFLKGPFHKSNGWDSKRVMQLVAKLADVINCYDERTLLPCAFSVGMDRYRNAASTASTGQVLRAATVCAVQCCQRILGALVPDSTDANATINIYRDSNDLYLGDLLRDWKSPKIRRSQLILERINMIASAEMKVTPGIQMADLLAWSVHRYLTNPEDEQAIVCCYLLRLPDIRTFGASNKYNN